MDVGKPSKKKGLVNLGEKRGPGGFQKRQILKKVQTNVIGAKEILNREKKKNGGPGENKNGKGMLIKSTRSTEKTKKKRGHR